MQKNLSNELLAEKFIIKTITRAENNNSTRDAEISLDFIGIDTETNPMLVFGPKGETITVWQTTYSVKAKDVGKLVEKYAGTIERHPDLDQLDLNLLRELSTIYKSITEGESKPEPEPETYAAIVAELEKLNETISGLY